MPTADILKQQRLDGMLALAERIGRHGTNVSKVGLYFFQRFWGHQRLMEVWQVGLNATRAA